LSKAELPAVVLQYGGFWAEFKVGFVLQKSVFNQIRLPNPPHTAALVSKTVSISFERQETENKK
jgi:hypothetical protein